MVEIWANYGGLPVGALNLGPDRPDQSIRVLRVNPEWTTDHMGGFYRCQRPIKTSSSGRIRRAPDQIEPDSSSQTQIHVGETKKGKAKKGEARDDPGVGEETKKRDVDCCAGAGAGRPDWRRGNWRKICDWVFVGWLYACIILFCFLLSELDPGGKERCQPLA